MRYQQLRRVHDHDERPGDQGVHAARRPGGRRRAADGRRPRHERRPASDSTGVLGRARPAVRLLHPGHDDGRPRAATPAPRADGDADPRRAGRQPLPVHRLPAHRELDSKRRREAARRRPGEGGAGGRPVAGAAAMAVSLLFGASIRRREDPRLITGQATYTDDLRLPGMVHACIVRSPHAHARITRIDADAARRHPGVVAVFTGRDLEGKLNPIPTAWLIPNSDLKTPPHPALAVDRVRYAGDGVAVVVADAPYTARDAAALVREDYEPLPANVKQEPAVGAGAQKLHAEAPSNSAYT